MDVLMAERWGCKAPDSAPMVPRSTIQARVADARRLGTVQRESAFLSDA